MSVIDSLSLGGTTYSLRDNDGRAIIAGTESSTTSAHAYSTGDYFILNDTLYEATAAIAVGGTITVGTNCQATTVCGEVGQLKSDFADMSDNLSDINDDLETVTVPGYNLLKIAQNGTGAYYKSGSVVKFDPTYTGYHYAIMPVEKNTRYYVSRNPRWWILTDDNDTIISSGTGFTPSTKKFIDTGIATRFYYTIDNSAWNAETVYGSMFAIIISKCDNGSGALGNKMLPPWATGYSQRMFANRYACAIPRHYPRFTVGFNQKWYYKNILALDNNCFDMGLAQYKNEVTNDYVGLAFTTAGNTACVAYVYDDNLELIEQQSQIDAKVFANNLSNCSALVIGDSTVAQNKMTEKMLALFTEQSLTLTLLGTQGTAPNNHEGRVGWSAEQYCTEASVSGNVNPFYNNGFDFSYYMTNQNYQAVDFVVLQLGINDLYNASLANADEKINALKGYIEQIIDSILAWNASQKIIINLLTPVASVYGSYNMKLKRNTFVRYNAMMNIELTKYDFAKVRISNCHLILDPSTDISDNVHPTTDGYYKMGAEVVSQINCWQNA